jgi:hypothetical protein
VLAAEHHVSDVVGAVAGTVGVGLVVTWLLWPARQNSTS